MFRQVTRGQADENADFLMLVEQLNDTLQEQNQAIEELMQVKESKFQQLTDQIKMKSRFTKLIM